MSREYDKLLRSLSAIREKVNFVPRVALILGSGLGDYASEIRIVNRISYSEIEGFPVSTVAGHAGEFIFGYIGEVPVVCMKGRVHFYEGYSVSEVVMPIRLMKLLGAEILFVTNAAGGINFDFTPGDLMVITDHISCFAPNPLIGENLSELGVRFPDMSHLYSQRIREIFQKKADENGILLKQGVYVQLTGPSYESPAEIRMLRNLGGDAVGMSTVVEVITARHCGMEIFGVSCITNLAAGMSNQTLNHKEVQETADLAAKKFSLLVTETITSL